MNITSSDYIVYKIYSVSLYRSSHRSCSLKKDVLQNQSGKIHRKTPVSESLLNKVYQKKTRCFSVNFAKFLEILFTEYIQTTASAFKTKKITILVLLLYFYCPFILVVLGRAFLCGKRSETAIGSIL